MYSYFLFLPSHSRRLTLARTSSALSPLTRSALQADTRDSAITPGLVVLVVRHLHSAVRKRGNKREKIKQRRKKKSIAHRVSPQPKVGVALGSPLRIIILSTALRFPSGSPRWTALPPSPSIPSPSRPPSLRRHQAHLNIITLV